MKGDPVPEGPAHNESRLNVVHSFLPRGLRNTIQVFRLRYQDGYEFSTLCVWPSRGIPSQLFITWGKQVALSLK